MEVDEPWQEASTSGTGAIGGVGGATTSSQRAAKHAVTLRDDDPFDLEGYVGPYSDRRRIERLLFVARSCPQLRKQAFTSALASIKQSTLDYRLYLEVLAESQLNDDDGDIVGREDWAEDARVKQENGLEKLDVELKNYQNNLIKESIRMGYRDIGDFQRKSGDLGGAIKSYAKSKDYCTTSQHILDMCLSVIDTALDQCSYPTIRNHVLKAEAALHAISGAASSKQASANSANGGSASSSSAAASRGVNLPGMISTAQPGKREEEARRQAHQLLGEKLSVASAVANLAQKDFKMAARQLLNVSPPSAASSSSSSSTTSSRDNTTGSNNTSHFISAADIGLYGVLTAMASMDRSQFKRMVLDNASFRPYLEYIPFLKDLIQKYYNSRFLEAIAILDSNMARLLLDVHLSHAVDDIVSRIKERMLALYFEPYTSVRIEKMASAFGWQAAELEHEMVRLIKQGLLKARIDKRAGTIQAYTPDERDVLYQRGLKTAAETDRTARALAFRIKLIQADLVVDFKKDSTVPPPQQQQQQQQQQQGSSNQQQQQGSARPKSSRKASNATEAIMVS